MATTYLLKSALLATLLASALIGPVAPFLAAPAQAESGPGKDGDGDRGDDRDDDNSGPGGGDDDQGDDDDDDDDGGDDDPGSGGPGSASPGSDSGWLGPPGDHGRIVRIEIRGGAIEVRYADGARERIANGRYEFRDASGRSERHTATGADIARLRKIARDAGAMPAAAVAPQRARVERHEARPGGIALYYSNGWTETVDAGIYLLADPFGRAITRRPATRADLDRLQRLADG